MRKVIDITCTPDTEYQKSTIVALCDDGTIWETWCTGTKGTRNFWSSWMQVPGIPDEVPK